MSYVQLLKNGLRYPVELLSARYGYHRRNSSDPRLWIMMYHRILPKSDARYSHEEPGMVVEPETFRMHLVELKKNFTVLSLSDWCHRKKKNLPLPEKACCITFDDGWLDNYEYALPILEQEQIPATLFAVADMIGTNEQFWPNRIIKLLQQPKDKLQQIPWLSQLIADQAINSEFSAQAIYSLKNYPDDQLLQLIEQAENDLSIPTNTKADLMNWDQLRELTESGLVEIGSHTSHHIRLKQELDENFRTREIVESKKRLESELDKSVEIFCYPNGDYCDAAVEEVSKHYMAAVTTERGINHSTTLSPFKMLRIGVHQDISNNRRRLLAKVANWP